MWLDPFTYLASKERVHLRVLLHICCIVYMSLFYAIYAYKLNIFRSVLSLSFFFISPSLSVYCFYLLSFLFIPFSSLLYYWSHLCFFSLLVGQAFPSNQLDISPIQLILIAINAIQCIFLFLLPYFISPAARYWWRQFWQLLVLTSVTQHASLYDR